MILACADIRFAVSGNVITNARIVPIKIVQLIRFIKVFIIKRVYKQIVG